MANNSKIMGTDIESIAKIMGVDTSSLYSVLGSIIPQIMTITPGSFTTFESARTEQMSMCVMDSTHAIVCYQDQGNSSYGTACCLTLSDSTITAGTPVVFESASTNSTAVCMMDSTHAIVIYMDTGNVSKGTACCLTLSGTTISAGSPVAFTGDYSSRLSVCSMDSTHAIACYLEDSGTVGNAYCLSLSGTTITAGTGVTFESGGVGLTGVCSLDSTNAIVCYGDSGNSSYATVCHLGLSGTTITAATPVVVENYGAGLCSICALDSTHALMTYVDNAAFGNPKACAMSLSGTTITTGTPITVSTTYLVVYGKMPVVKISASKALMCYRDDNYGRNIAHCLNVSGTTVTAESGINIETGYDQYQCLGVMSSTKVIFAIEDTSGSYYGKACCLTLS
jgi:hypothetical protein